MRTRGNYYVEAIERRPDGRRFGREIGRQVKTFKQARAILDAADLRGFVQVWSDRTYSRTIVAERDEAGNWWTPNPFTGNLTALD